MRSLRNCISYNKAFGIWHFVQLAYFSILIYAYISVLMLQPTRALKGGVRFENNLFTKAKLAHVYGKWFNDTQKMSVMKCARRYVAITV